MKRWRPKAEDSTIGWICPLALENAAAKSALDEVYEEAEYATGRIHHHGIRMRVAFPSLKHALMVGIADGFPSDKVDIRLGDIVVGQPDRQYGGVRIGYLNRPSHDLLVAVSKFKANLVAERNKFRMRISDLLPSTHDVLFQPSYDHVGGNDCAGCCKDMLVSRSIRDETNCIFFGTIASGNQDIKDGVTRDMSSSELGGVLCFEMEAAGVANSMPCLVIRGVCDYADSHKNKAFQPFAAAAAAACARTTLLYLPRALCVRLNDGQTPGHGQLQLEAQDRHWKVGMQPSGRRPLNTCQWLLMAEEYEKWLDMDHFDQHRGFLWITAKPGAGQSTLMKSIVRKATRNMPDVTGFFFFFFFFFSNARGEALEKTQLLDKLPNLQTVFDTLSTTPTRGRPPDWDIETLEFLLCAAADQVSVCFASRHSPHVTIENKIELVLEDQDGHQQDIANYVHPELKIGRKFDRGRVHALHRRLREIPDGLHSLLKDIPTRDNHNMNATLLSGTEPDCEFLAGWTAVLVTEDVLHRFVLDCSKGLAEQSRSRIAPKMLFIHESVRDFLRADGLADLKVGSITPGHSHEALKFCYLNYVNIDYPRICLSQRTFQRQTDRARLLKPLFQHYPLLQYAVENVFYHANEASKHGISQVS
ncbi:nucleoside phosphorylase domain-containing protein [Aspergillus nidulans var. acristatus]